jgi:hypothetical protein
LSELKRFTNQRPGEVLLIQNKNAFGSNEMKVAILMRTMGRNKFEKIYEKKN